ncbi:hypothetical protein PVK06_050035 [Gossypium arboreum]|uniref:Uncharacterized protein n=1 Tax=Gossypium arboreum TaxID=29729 RepID=A0ABR0MA21_GOSAR|nr:hypothetical protein PVK06_050035 [Gossypium arboreum]
MSSQLLRLNAFRGEPASSGFEWHFTPNHNSSADSSTSVGSDPPLSFTQASSWSWIDHPGVFSLARWSLLIHTGFHVPHATRVRALLPFRSPLLRESLLLSFPPATKMFQFARLSLVCPWIQQQFERLTYSGISGSTLIFNSPKHFVAYYALPRLWVPRYPP